MERPDLMVLVSRVSRPYLSNMDKKRQRESNGSPFMLRLLKSTARIVILVTVADPKISRSRRRYMIKTDHTFTPCYEVENSQFIENNHSKIRAWKCLARD